jgi:predicted AAA+ superfamily ATPase
MIARPHVIQRIARALTIHPVAALLGPRQCGKTTVARVFAEHKPSTYFDLENPVDVRRLSAPLSILQELTGRVILDEVQRRPDRCALLRLLVDRPQNAARFLLPGSASPHLVQGGAEALAGRIGCIALAGCDLAEVGAPQRARLWLRGGFPRAFLADAEAASMTWRTDCMRTFLERDIPQWCTPWRTNCSSVRAWASARRLRVSSSRNIYERPDPYPSLALWGREEHTQQSSGCQTPCCNSSPERHQTALGAHAQLRGAPL